MAHQIAHPTARTSGIPGPSELNYTPGAPGHFTEGDPVTGEPATVVTMDWLNMVQDEIKSVVEGAGLTLANPNDPDNTQLSQAIPILSRWNLPVRAVVNYGNTSPQGDHDASSDRGRVIPCDASLGNLRILLPSAASAGNGFALAILKADSSSNQVSITPHGSDNIQGEAQAFTLVSQNQSVLLASDGISGWQIISNTQEDADIFALQTDIDLNVAKIAALEATALSLRDGVAFDLDSMNDADSGSSNIHIFSGKVTNGSDFGPFTAYTFTGGDQAFTVPTGATAIRAKIVGGGGGGQARAFSTSTHGGAGGFAQADITVTSNEILILSVGGGGTGATTGQGGGSGGGFTGIFRSVKSQANALLIAGGGGGQGQDSDGGDGGGLRGSDGSQLVWSGKGGDQSNGGASRGNGESGAILRGGDSTKGRTPTTFITGGYNGGGNSAEENGYGGGGGGGYYGGGSGDGGTMQDGSGGGGSGYFHPAYTSAQILTTGVNGIPNTDADFALGTGKGGNAENGGVTGGNGQILIAIAQAGLNMDWITPMEVADSDVIRHRVQCVIKADNLDLNNNLVISATSDQGSTWDQLTAEHIGTLDDGRKLIVAEGVDTAGGINVQARFQTNSGIDVEISDVTHRWEN